MVEGEQCAPCAGLRQRRCRGEHFPVSDGRLDVDGAAVPDQIGGPELFSGFGVVGSHLCPSLVGEDSALADGHAARPEDGDAHLSHPASFTRRQVDCVYVGEQIAEVDGAVDHDRSRCRSAEPFASTESNLF